jgi:hypothetical protein
MARLFHAAARFGLSLVVFLLALAIGRWGPIHAEPFVPVAALPLVPWLLGFAVAAALTAGARSRHAPLRASWMLAVAAACALALVVAVRPPAGLGGEVRDGSGDRGVLAAGPIDVVPGDLPAAVGRDWSVLWRGELRAPQSGAYRFTVVGRGRVRVLLDGRAILEAEGEQLNAAAEQQVGRGPHALEVFYERTGREELRAARVRGHRLRLEWTLPGKDGAPGERSEPIPPRHLGPAGSRALWWLTDWLVVAVAASLSLLSWAVPWQRRAPPEPARPMSGAEWAWSAAAHAVILLLMSWPLAAGPASRGVVGRADGDLNVWILAWGAHALLHQPARLFQAPIFHPAPDALAFSENLLVPALIGLPAQVGGPVLAYNFVFLLSALGSGLGVQLLVRRGSGDPLAAFAAGALFAAGHHRWVRMAHLHAQVTLFLPFAIWALDRLWQRPTRRRGVVLGLFLALQLLSSVYLGAITATIVCVGIALGLCTRSRLRLLAPAALALGLAALLSAPLLAPYFRMRAHQGVEWTLADVEPHATTLTSYVAAGSRLYDGLTRRHLDPDSHRRPLFPGVVPLFLGIAGLASAPRRFRVVGLAASAVAVLFSLGPETGLYRFLHEQLVPLRGIRALNRFALVPVLALCVWSAFALGGRRRLALAALFAALLEACAAPIDYGRYDAPPPAARFLSGGTGAVLWLPLGEQDSRVMLDGLAHLRPLVNGYSGVTPRHHAWAAETLEPADAPEALRYLRAIGVTHVVAAGKLALPPLATFETHTVFAVPAGEAAAPITPAQPAAVLVSGDAATLDLGAAAEVERLTFRPPDAPPANEARVQLSLDGRSWQDVDARLSLAATALSLAVDPARGQAELRWPRRRARFVRVEGSWIDARETLGVQ